MIVSSSAASSVALTKSDTTSVTCDMLYVGGTGNIHIKHTSGGAVVIYTAPPIGTILPVSLKDGRLMAATTVTDGLVVAMKL